VNEERPRPCKVLVLSIPTSSPRTSAGRASSGAPWKTEYDVVHTLSELGHESQVLPVGGDLGVLRNGLYDFKPSVDLQPARGFDEVVTFDANVVATSSS
jgi:hypothetical protein